jgi:hypothetical protein
VEEAIRELFSESWMTSKHSSNPGPPHNPPKTVIETFHRAMQELRQSELGERALKTGDRSPAFTLNKSEVMEILAPRLARQNPGVTLGGPVLPNILPRRRSAT